MEDTLIAASLQAGLVVSEDGRAVVSDSFIERCALVGIALSGSAVCLCVCMCSCVLSVCMCICVYVCVYI